MGYIAEKVEKIAKGRLIEVRFQCSKCQRTLPMDPRPDLRARDFLFCPFCGVKYDH